MEIKSRARIELIQLHLSRLPANKEKIMLIGIYRVLTFCSQGVHHQKTITYTMNEISHISNWPLISKNPIPTTTPPLDTILSSYLLVVRVLKLLWPHDNVDVSLCCRYAEYETWKEVGWLVGWPVHNRHGGRIHTRCVTLVSPLNTSSA